MLIRERRTQTARRAQQVFRDLREAKAWLRQVVPSLGNRRPIDLLATPDG